ncbi:unnamed protein product [Trypanosoma congolense IL3000]|uniref:WGS project CAEQ00000000 data, annotated contig 903 n=1 Tax=Trypanosoma congolense (strain IL3000) TaxID=1068625 RepID=F9WJF2_TRYCI|nr:unnamed protein product [Trypanosoma congolense IL3000]
MSKKSNETQEVNEVHASKVGVDHGEYGGGHLGEGQGRLGCNECVELFQYLLRQPLWHAPPYCCDHAAVSGKSGEVCPRCSQTGVYPTGPEPQARAHAEAPPTQPRQTEGCRYCFPGGVETPWVHSGYRTDGAHGVGPCLPACHAPQSTQRGSSRKHLMKRRSGECNRIRGACTLVSFSVHQSIFCSIIAIPPHYSSTRSFLPTIIPPTHPSPQGITMSNSPSSPSPAGMAQDNTPWSMEKDVVEVLLKGLGDPEKINLYRFLDLWRCVNAFLRFPV